MRKRKKTKRNLDEGKQDMEWEFRVLDMIQTLRMPLDDVLIVYVSRLGDGGAIWIVLAAVLLLIPRMRKAGIVVALALLMDVILCNVMLKNMVARVRPCDVRTYVDLLIARPDDFSFPSGHTAASFAAASSLCFSGKERLCRPAFALAILIAFSRLYLYVHYPTDILGGILVGVLCGYMAYRVTERGETCHWRKRMRKG